METIASVTQVAIPDVVLSKGAAAPVMPPAAIAPEVAPKEKIKNQTLRSLVKDLNASVKLFNTNISFSIDKDTGKEVIKVVNADTKEVIRQIPEEDALRIASHIKELLGILYDNKR